MLLPKGNKGFTLTEVIIVIAIVGLVSVIAVPSINSFLPGYRLRAATRDMVSFLREARLQAVKHAKACEIDTDDFTASVDGQVVARFSFSKYPGIELDTSKGGGDGLSFEVVGFGFNPRGLLPTTGSIYLINHKGGTREVSFTLAGAVRVEQ